MPTSACCRRPSPVRPLPVHAEVKYKSFREELDSNVFPCLGDREGCRRLMEGGVTINRPPRDGRMAFVRTPDNISIELLQQGAALPPAEPWASMPNTGQW